jgi:hypothetical protein
MPNPRWRDRPLQPQQVDGKRFIREHHHQAGLFMAPGTGKTLVAIRSEHDQELVLLICRRDDFMTWQDELVAEGMSPPTIVTGRNVAQVAYELDECTLVAHDPTGWFMISHDSLRNKAVFEFVLSGRWQVVIVDEGHAFKRLEAERTKRLIKATRHIPRRLELTGTPITNQIEDIFSQALFIDDGKTFGRDYWKFMLKYYIKASMIPGKWFIKRGSKERIAAKIPEFAFSVHEDDVLRLPPKRFVKKAVPLTGRTAEEYNRLLTTWEYEIEKGHPITVDYITVQLIKLQQIAAGFIYDEEHRPVWLGDDKVDLCESTLMDMLAHKPKVVIWCNFLAEVDRLFQSARDRKWGKAVRFDSKDREERNAARKQFAQDPKTRLFISQVDRGVGMNELVVADTSIYHSNSHRVVSRQQSMRRTRRIGSQHHESILYIDHLAESTVDVAVYRAVTRGVNVAHQVTFALQDGKTLRSALTLDPSGVIVYDSPA